MGAVMQSRNVPGNARKAQARAARHGERGRAAELIRPIWPKNVTPASYRVALLFAEPPGARLRSRGKAGRASCCLSLVGQGLCCQVAVRVIFPQDASELVAQRRGAYIIDRTGVTEKNRVPQTTNIPLE